jgi:Cu/Ag efflux pump CusA
VDDLSQASLEKCIEEIKKHMEVTRGQIDLKALKVIYRPADIEALGLTHSDVVDIVEQAHNKLKENT